MTPLGNGFACGQPAPHGQIRGVRAQEISDAACIRALVVAESREGARRADSDREEDVGHPEHRLRPGARGGALLRLDRRAIEVYRRGLVLPAVHAETLTYTLVEAKSSACREGY